MLKVEERVLYKSFIKNTDYDKLSGTEHNICQLKSIV